MLTTLLVSAGTKVLGAFGQGKKSSSNASSSTAGSGPGSPAPSTASAGNVPAGMQMRSGTVMEKKMTNTGSETESIEIVDNEG